MSLLSIVATAILPIVALAGVGALLARTTGVEADALNTVTIYVLAPALVFHSLATTDLGGETLASVAVGVFLFTVAMALLAEGVGRSPGETEPILGTLVLVAAFSNAGNYGIPVSEFAFGAVGLVGDSAIPVVLLILGIELATTEVGSATLRVSPATVLKLAVAPIVGVAVALGVGFQNPDVARVFVLECAMPTAVTTLILTGEFAGPAAGDLPATDDASTTVFVTTLLSVPLLTALIAILQDGFVL